MERLFAFVNSYDNFAVPRRCWPHKGPRLGRVAHSSPEEEERLDSTCPSPSHPRTASRLLCSFGALVCSFTIAIAPFSKHGQGMLVTSARSEKRKRELKEVVCRTTVTRQKSSGKPPPSAELF